MGVKGIVAVSSNGVIGCGNDLPWDIPEDRANFRRLTMGGTVIMGRLTWDSLGRPLPGRTNVVLSRQSEVGFPGAVGVNTTQKARACARGTQAWVIGGRWVYGSFMDDIHEWHVTRVEAAPDGDVHFDEQWLAGFEVTHYGHREISRVGGLAFQTNVYRRVGI